MNYWIFIDKRTGKQVEWNDEYQEWLESPSYGVVADDDNPRSSENIEMVLVELTDRRFPVTTSRLSYPHQPYGENMPELVD